MFFFKHFFLFSRIFSPKRNILSRNSPIKRYAAEVDKKNITVHRTVKYILGKLVQKVEKKSVPGSDRCGRRGCSLYVCDNFDSLSDRNKRIYKINLPAFLLFFFFFFSKCILVGKNRMAVEFHPSLRFVKFPNICLHYRTDVPSTKTKISKCGEDPRWQSISKSTLRRCLRFDFYFDRLSMSSERQRIFHFFFLYSNPVW